MKDVLYNVLGVVSQSQGSLNNALEKEMAKIAKQYDADVKASFDEGYQTGIAEEEMIGVNYAVAAFADVETLDDFKEKYKELVNRSLNFLKPIGL